MENDSKLSSMDDALSEAAVGQEDSLMLIKVEDDANQQLQVDFPVDKSNLDSLSVSGRTVATVSLAVGSSPLNISQIELTDGSILLESTEGIQSALDSGAIQLHSTSESYDQNLVAIDEADSCDATSKFIDGQAVRLEDGTMAYIHTMPREGLQPVQLEDGTMAYLSQARDELFNGEASGLDLDQLASPQMPIESAEDRDAIMKMMTIPESVLEKETSKVAPTNNRKNGKSGSTAEKSFHCPYEGCSRVYTTQHHLKVHERSHTGDRPFKCVVPKCGKAFATGYGLKSHTRVHTGETPYKCNEASCTKAFKTSGDLQKHLRTHTGERPFKCPIEGCHRAFTTSNIRKVHIRTHTGERPYICEACGRAFASATNFKNHIRIHTGEKPYVCTFQGCNKKFTEYSSLYKHHVVHTRDKPYACKLCGKHYRQTSTLATHERTSHRNTEKTASKGTNTIETEITKEEGEKIADALKKQICFEFDAGNDLMNATNILLKNVQSLQENMESRNNKKIPTIIALQSDASQLLQENSPVYAVQLQQDGSVGAAQQILLVTDPAQLAALQQLAQVHLQNVASSNNVVSKTN